MTQWVRTCTRDDIDAEGLIRIDHDGRIFAIHRSPDDGFCRTDGLCTQETVNLADGLVTDHVIECPGHDGQFDCRTGELKRAQDCGRHQTCPVLVEGEDILIG